jgi:hypothetical protein
MFAMIVTLWNDIAQVFADARQLQLVMHKRYPGQHE